MRLVRILDPIHYDTELKRFKSLAFRSDISVFIAACGITESGGVCQHINGFYKAIAGAPAVFWQFPASSLPESASLIPGIGTTGDSCHLEIKLPRNEAKRFFEAACLEASYACIDPAEPSRLALLNTHELLTSLKRKRDDEITNTR